MFYHPEMTISILCVCIGGKKKKSRKEDEKWEEE